MTRCIGHRALRTDKRIPTPKNTKRQQWFSGKTRLQVSSQIIGLQLRWPSRGGEAKRTGESRGWPQKNVFGEKCR